ncbi:NnrS family protein [Rhizobium sp. 18055]|uniref:NnrS family protein n=1 Tax=Rhizobium sp. 18055 TaxID=2681403 RepID=UPI00135C81DF|nr:NnrS family protein [Rhizobium sp. 18055]
MQKKKNASANAPRGMSREGLVIFSYGFRPFFLAAAIWAIVSIDIWAAFLTLGLPVATDYGTLYWHAHEMLFGFAPAILAGFLLTAIPNWTGRLPIAGRPLMCLFALWSAGRVAMLSSGVIGVAPAAAIDALFLPAMLVLCAREVVAGKKWKDLKVIAGLVVLSAANLLFHIQAIAGNGPDVSIRLGLGAYILLVTIVGGRILPSFTRNWINQFGRTDFPVPYNRFDAVTIVIGAMSLAIWSLTPATLVSGALGLLAAGLNVARLVRWRGWVTWPEPIVFILHAAFAFVPLGFAAIALEALGLPELAVIHIFAIGGVSLMMLAVMTRASRGHTGRKLKSSLTTNASYVLLAAVALVRPIAELLPNYGSVIVLLAAAGWTAAFALFVYEHAGMLCIGRKPLTIR